MRALFAEILAQLDVLGRHHLAHLVGARLLFAQPRSTAAVWFDGAAHHLALALRARRAVSTTFFALTWYWPPGARRAPPLPERRRLRFTVAASSRLPAASVAALPPLS